MNKNKYRKISTGLCKHITEKITMLHNSKYYTQRIHCINRHWKSKQKENSQSTPIIIIPVGIIHDFKLTVSAFLKRVGSVIVTNDAGRLFQSIEVLGRNDREHAMVL